MPETSLTNKRKLRNNISLQVLSAIVAAIVLGKLDPKLALAMKPLGDLFIKLIRMAIAPIVFLCVSTGVAHIGDIRKVGRIGLKALVYFELVTTVSLVIGLASVAIFKPGAGVNALPSVSASGDYAAYASKGKEFSFLELAMGTVPDNFLGAFVKRGFASGRGDCVISRHHPNWNGEPRAFRCSGSRHRDDGIFRNH